MPVPVSEYEGRVARLRRFMGRRGIDACLVGNRADMRYLAGTAESSVLAIPLEGEPFLVAVYAFGDGLAEEESPFWVETVIPHYGLERRDVKKADPLGRAVEMLRDGGVPLKRIGVDGSLEFRGEVRKALKRIVGGRRSLPTLDVGKEIGKMRSVKSEVEISLLRESARTAVEAFYRAAEHLRPGVTEREVANRLLFEMRELGAEGPSFPPIVAFGEHTFNAHHVPTMRRLGEGEAVLLDWGASVEGYASDMTRTFHLGGPDEKFSKRFEAVRRAKSAAMEAVRPGVPVSEPDAEARRVLKSSGLLDYYVHGLGHGVGLEVHEMPRLLVGARGRLARRMAVTVEPGVYLKGWGGIRIEDTVVVRASGPEVISAGLPEGPLIPGKGG